MSASSVSSVARLVSRFQSLLRPVRSIMPVAVPRSPVSAAADEPAAKRAKVESPTTTTGTVSASNAPNANGTPLSKKARQALAKAQAKHAEATTSFRPLPTVPTAEDLARIEELMAADIEFPKTYAHEVQYRDKMVLAPMVRSGTLPTRLLSLYYGAGLVWTPEIVDKAIIGATREVDPETGVITYHKGQGPIFTCHPVEKPFLIFQIGSSNPELAVQAARIVAQDVSGIDLNCGCPKPFSTHSGMGAALLSTPDLLLDILRALLQNIPLPISAKIRLMPTRAETMVLAARILKTGVRNLTVHCRTRDMRPREKAIHERLGEVVQLGKRRGVPVTCNGDGEGWENWNAIKDATGADSLMIARAAESNPSCFAPEVSDATTVVVPQLLSWVAHTNHNWGNTKFLLSQFKAAGPLLSKQQKKEAMHAVARGKTVEDVAAGIAAVVAPVMVDVSAAKGKEFVDELTKRMKERAEWGVFEKDETARDSAVAAMVAAAAAEAEAAAAAAPTPAADEPTATVETPTTATTA